MAMKNFSPKHRKDSSKAFNAKAHIDRMYDRVWDNYRARFLAVNKLCYACGAPATVVDHLKPHKGDQRLFEKLDNHLPLCVPCHNTVTTKFDRNYRVGNPITPKITWLNSRRFPREDWTPARVKVLDRYK